jgi:hypothetical protein
MRLNCIGIGCFLFLAHAARGQTAYGLVTGTVRDAVTQETVASPTVSYTDLNTGKTEARKPENGVFTFLALSPGKYRVWATAPGYQDRLIEELDLPVAGHLEITFDLWKLSDPWHAGAYKSVVMPGSHAVASYYGPDIDTTRSDSFEPVDVDRSRLESALSAVIDSRDIAELPLAGRDIYTVLVLLPGVTADLATARGLGFSVTGQRPSSSNYLLDGLEYNDLLVTGPLGAIAPESVQEYRISTNNFSAEYGRTSGFVASAVSITGGSAAHGMLYTWIKNDLLDANGFQENANGYARAPQKEQRPGFVVSGPLLPGRIFGSGSLEFLHFGSRNDPEQFTLPTASFISRSDPNTPAGWLLRHYAAAAVPQSDGDFGFVTIAPPVELDGVVGLARIDYLPGTGRHRLFFRASANRERTPDLLYNPYPQFSSPYHQGAIGLAMGWTWQISAKTTNEFRIGRTGDSAKYDRPHTEVPLLRTYTQLTSNGTLLSPVLPGSHTTLTLRYVPRNWETIDNWSHIQGRHFWKVGGGVVLRTIDSAFIADRDGSYVFNDASDFLNGTPYSVMVAYDRAAAGYTPVPYNRIYRYADLDFFAQDVLRASTRLALNYGVRYDFFGAPVNIGPAKDTLVTLGSGAALFQTRASGNQRLFNSDRKDWAFRGGFSYDITGRGNTLFRGSYGIFYDRAYDNLWETVPLNRQVIWSWYFNGAQVNFLRPVFSQLPLGVPTPQQSGFHTPILFQSDLRNPRVETAFIGLQQKLGDSVTVEANAIVSRGRRLWTNDVIDRDFLFPAVQGAERSNTDPVGYLNFRADQGESRYAGVTTALRYRSRRFSGQIAYTWSHSIDNQSDPLIGAFGSFNVSREAAVGDPNQLALFNVQGDPRADRGNSDFDQRQNLVFYGTELLPHGWRISGLGAIRSGLPFTVFAGSFNQRANLILPFAARRDPPTAIGGGELVLNSSAFSPPQDGVPGTLGRNALAGPGLISADLSIARSFALRALGEAGRFVLRADFYNAFNHANLNNPQSTLGAAQFGQALYGRQEKNAGFPLLIPLNETARQVQLLLRVEF